MWVYGKKFGLYSRGYMSSFTLCWLSLLNGFLGFKGFIGKVDNPPFLLWGALVFWGALV